MKPLGKSPVPMEPLPSNFISTPKTPATPNNQFQTTQSSAQQPATGNMSAGFSNNQAALMQGSRFDPAIAAYGNSFSGWYGYLNSIFSIMLSSSTMRAAFGLNKNQMNDDNPFSAPEANPAFSVDEDGEIIQPGKQRSLASRLPSQSASTFTMPINSQSQQIEKIQQIQGKPQFIVPQDQSREI